MRFRSYFGIVRWGLGCVQKRCSWVWAIFGESKVRFGLHLEKVRLGLGCFWGRLGWV